MSQQSLLHETVLTGREREEWGAMSLLLLLYCPIRGLGQGGDHPDSK